jgi:oligopeptidase A
MMQQLLSSGSNDATPPGGESAPSGGPLTWLRSEIPFADIRPEHAGPAIDTLLADAEARLDAVRNASPRTWESTAAPFDRATEALDRAWAVIGHMRSVVHSDAWEQIYTALIPRVSEFYARIPLDGSLWRALAEYAETPEAQALTGHRRRFLDRTLAEFRRNGAALPPEGKAQLAGILSELAQLATTFSHNVLSATAAWSLDVTDPARLEGVPAPLQAMMRDAAEAAGAEGWRVTLAGPLVTAILTYGRDRALREEVWRGYSARASQPPHDNTGIVSRMLQLRQEQAKLLGFEHFADLVLHDRMAHDARTAIAFVDRMEAAARPAFEREIAELQAWARAQGGPDPLAPWDVGFWSERQREALYDIDQEALRPYFSFDQVMRGLFELVHRLYGVTIQASNAPSWHSDARAYDVLDEDGTTLGVFHADFFSRPTKRDGAWMNGLRIGDPIPAPDPTGSRPPQHGPHVGVICGDLTPPAGGRPSLLTFREVETIFHELGHLMHHLLTRTELYRQGGTNVAWDFVELPSQIMENWCVEREVLDMIARHVDTGERLPDEIVDRLRRARTFRAATTMMRQLGFCRVDLELHTGWDPSRGDLLDFGRAVLARYAPAPLTPDHTMVTWFSHLFSDPVGYAAGYYSYQWAAVLDADAFSRFRQAGLFDADVGRTFREQILSRGDSEDPAVLFRAFMGRDPDPAAHLARSGLK